jgi:hypothetical protein
MVDYYLIHGPARLEGILVEEFVRHKDFSTAGLHNARWSREDRSREDRPREDWSCEDQSREDKTREDQSREDWSREDWSREDKTHEDKTHEDKTHEGRWSSDTAFSRSVRTDPRLSARVVPTTRAGAERAYPGRLPAEPVLRTYFRDYDEYPAAAPLLALTPAPPPPEGFREKRLYRVLFAKTPAKPEPATGRLVEGGEVYTWQLRRIGDGLGWSLDVSVLLKEGTSIGPVLDRLTDLTRIRHGLIPVTTERFQ